MAFESGAMSFRLFFLPKKLPMDVVEKFAENAVSSIDSLGEEPVHGWVSGRHMLDRNINEETAYFGGYLKLALLTAERKIPASLMQAEYKLEELAHLAAGGQERLSNKQRRDVRDSVKDRLLPQMPPQLSGVHFVYHEGTGLIYASALSEKQLDLFLIYMRHVIGFSLLPGSPDAVAIERRKTFVSDWKPFSFSPKVTDPDVVIQNAGCDFLTWLWFYTERRGGLLDVEGHGRIGVMLEGPLVLAYEGSGAQETVLKKGAALLSPEIGISLTSGRKLKSAKITFADDDESFEFTLGAEEFVIRSLKVPPVDEMGAIGRFQERMLKLQKFTDIFFAFYETFIDERSDEARWKKTREEIFEWVADRS